MLVLTGVMTLTTYGVLAQSPTFKTVSMKNLMYDPSTITVTVGQAVVWRNDETGAITHTTTSGTCVGPICTPLPGWDSGILNPGMSFTQTFTVAGTFPYFCKVHGSAMQGTVHVVAAAATSTPTASSTATRTSTPTTPSPSPTNTLTPAATGTATASLTSTPTATSTATATVAITRTVTPTATSTPAATASGGSDLTPWIVGGLIVLAVAGIGLALYRRRAA
jgi:plastocyanin